MDNLFKRICSCRICGGGNLTIVLDLGDQPPANLLRKSLKTSLPKIPLQLACCNSCGSAQLSVSVNSEYLFRHYVWVTGTAETTRKYSLKFCDRVLERMPTGRSFKILEVASNDGTFLSPFKARGHKVLGIDPAENIAKIANKRGISTIPGFFGSSAAENIVSSYGRADCVFARNVVSHVEDAHDVIEGMAKCLSDDGLGAIEFHYAGIIQAELHYDSIYHEHNLYLSLNCLLKLLEQHSLCPYDVNKTPISGGSLVAYFSKTRRDKTKKLQYILKQEKENKLNTVESWMSFAKRADKHRDALLMAVRKVPPKIIGYGASARSSTMLNFCGINGGIIECIADKSRLKHNKFTPGTDIKVVSVEDAFALEPKSILLLAWNFRGEILDLLKNRMEFSGAVVIPFPVSVKVMQL